MVEYDLEAGNSIPFPTSSFQGIVVTNYLYRPIFPQLLCLLDVGMLIYETFAAGHEKYGRQQIPMPANSGELINLVSPEMRVMHMKSV